MQISILTNVTCWTVLVFENNLSPSSPLLLTSFSISQIKTITHELFSLQTQQLLEQTTETVWQTAQTLCVWWHLLSCLKSCIWNDMPHKKNVWIKKQIIFVDPHSSSVGLAEGLKISTVTLLTFACMNAWQRRERKTCSKSLQVGCAFWSDQYLTTSAADCRMKN